jgi:serine-protein kinase ATM
MANRLVSYRDIAEDVDAMVTATEISAPAILSDSSLSLMTHLVTLRNMEVPGGNSAVCHHIIRWISARWDPSKPSNIPELILCLLLY